MHLKMSSAKWRPFCLGLNVLKGKAGLLVIILFVSVILISSPTTCLRYAVVREKDAHDEHACAGKGRISHLHTSITNRVEIHIVTPQVFSDRGQFMIYYEGERFIRIQEGSYPQNHGQRSAPS